MNEFQTNIDANNETPIEAWKSYNRLNFWSDTPDELINSYDWERDRVNKEALTKAERLFPEIRLEISQTFWWLSDSTFQGISTQSNKEIHLLNSNSLFYDEYMAIENEKEQLEEDNPWIEDLGFDYTGEHPNIEHNDVIRYWGLQSQLGIIDEYINIISEEQTLLHHSVQQYETRNDFEEAYPWVAYDFDSQSPINFMVEDYKDRSEDDKIQLLLTVWSILWEHYDHNLLDNVDQQWLSSEQMWEQLAAGDDAWICWDIHKEMLKLAKWLGLSSEVIAVNTWESGHMIVRGERSNWKFFIVDYGSYIEGESVDEVTDYYHLQKNAISSWSYVADEHWKIRGMSQTDLQKRTWEIIYISDSWDINDDWVDIQLWWSWEFKLQYSKSISNTQFFVFEKRMKAYWEAQDYTGIGLQNQSESRDWWIQGVKAHQQDTLSLSWYFVKKKSIWALELHAWTSTQLTFNPNWDLWDGSQKVFIWLQWERFFGNLNTSIVSKNMWDNEIAIDNISHIPQLNVWYTWDKYSVWAEATEIQQSINIWMQTTSGHLTSKLTNTNNVIGKGNSVALGLSNSWLVWKWQLEVDIMHEPSHTSGSISYKRTF